jgi:hypothetical protein
MDAIKATYKQGQIVPDEPVDWPEGHRLLVQEDPFPEIEFMNENEQSDDPAEIQKWIEDLRSIPPLPMTPDEEAKLLAWREQVKKFNLEAVRKQMEEKLP